MRKIKMKYEMNVKNREWKEEGGTKQTDRDGNYERTADIQIKKKSRPNESEEGLRADVGDIEKGREEDQETDRETAERKFLINLENIAAKLQKVYAKHKIS